MWSSSATLQINPKTKSNVNEGINQGGAGAGAGGEGLFQCGPSLLSQSTFQSKY